MKHTLHKWGGNISSIHNIIGNPPKNYRARLGKKTGKVGNFQARVGGSFSEFEFLQNLRLKGGDGGTQPALAGREREEQNPVARKIK